MMHKAWRNVEEVQYNFGGHSSNFNVTWAEKSMILIQFDSFYKAGHSWQIPQISLVVSRRATDKLLAE